MPSTYDAIVLGTGGVGSAALLHLARRGAHVIGLDRFAPPHDRGSSHGHTRVIRQAYFEHSDYVPLVLESYRLWADLEQQVGRKLNYETGIIEIGPPDGTVLPGVLRAAEQHALAVEQLSAAEIKQHWPGLRLPASLAGVFEQRGGYLLVEDCVQSHLDAAVQAGAELKTGCEVHAWSTREGEVMVTTADGTITGKKLIVTAGAWAAQLLHGLNVDLTVRRKSLFWFSTDDPSYHVKSGMPVFYFELPEGHFYGFPTIDERGLKLAEHSGGKPVADPLSVDRSRHADEEQRLITFLEAHFPGVSPHVTDHAACMYTMTPDKHFIIDRHPLHDNVVLAAGLSGHGFKFTPALGKAVADLAIDERTSLPIEFLGLGRFNGT